MLEILSWDYLESTCYGLHFIHHELPGINDALFHLSSA